MWKKVLPILALGINPFLIIDVFMPDSVQVQKTKQNTSTGQPLTDLKNKALEVLSKAVDEYKPQIIYGAVGIMAGRTIYNKISQIISIADLQQNAMIYVNPNVDSKRYFQIVKVLGNLAAKNGGTVRLVLKNGQAINLVTLDPNINAAFKLIGQKLHTVNFKNNNYKTDTLTQFISQDLKLRKIIIQNLIKQFKEKKRKKPGNVMLIKSQQKKYFLNNSFKNQQYDLAKDWKNLKNYFNPMAVARLQNYGQQLWKIYNTNDASQLRQLLSSFLKEYPFYLNSYDIMSWQNFKQLYYRGKISSETEYQKFQVQLWKQQAQQVINKLKDTGQRYRFQTLLNKVDTYSTNTQTLHNHIKPFTQNNNFYSLTIPSIMKNNLFQVLKSGNSKQIGQYFTYIRQQKLANQQPHYITSDQRNLFKQTYSKFQGIVGQQHSQIRLTLNLVQLNTLFHYLDQPLLPANSVQSNDQNVLINTLQRLSSVKWQRITSDPNILNFSQQTTQGMIQWVYNAVVKRVVKQQLIKDLNHSQKKQFQKKLSFIAYQQMIKKGYSIQTTIFLSEIFHWTTAGLMVVLFVTIRYLVKSYQSIFNQKFSRQNLWRKAKALVTPVKIKSPQLQQFIRQIQKFHPFLKQLKQTYDLIQSRKIQGKLDFNPQSQQRIQQIKKFAQKTQKQYQRLVDHQFFVQNSRGQRFIVNAFKQRKQNQNKGFYLNSKQQEAKKQINVLKQYIMQKKHNQQQLLDDLDQQEDLLNQKIMKEQKIKNQQKREQKEKNKTSTTNWWNDQKQKILNKPTSWWNKNNKTKQKQVQQKMKGLVQSISNREKNQKMMKGLVQSISNREKNQKLMKELIQKEKTKNKQLQKKITQNIEQITRVKLNDSIDFNQKKLQRLKQAIKKKKR